MGDGAAEEQRFVELLWQAESLFAERAQRLARRCRWLPGVQFDAIYDQVYLPGAGSPYLFVQQEERENMDLPASDPDFISYAKYTPSYCWSVHAGPKYRWHEPFSSEPWVDIHLTINADEQPQLELSWVGNTTGVCYPGTPGGWDEAITFIQATMRRDHYWSPFGDRTSWRWDLGHLIWRRLYLWWLCRPGL